MDNTAGRNPTIAYVAPFVLYIALLGIEHSVHFPLVAMHSARFLLVLAVIIFYSRPFFSLRPSHPVASIVIGVAVFLIWIGPDLLFGYRHHWLFENSITGKAATAFPAEVKGNAIFLGIRMLTTAGLVPILEELFWRGWMMRWLINGTNFQKVLLGTYQPFAFWLTAILFASEHGPFWEVGLAAGVIYNWWLIRTKSLADCILAHAVTNLVLGVYVLTAGQWQYWL